MQDSIMNINLFRVMKLVITESFFVQDGDQV